MSRPNRPNDLEIEGAVFGFRNFSGKETDYSPEGTRQFGVIIDPELAMQLKADGWNIKERANAEEPTYYLSVAVRFDPFPPKIIMFTESGGRTILTEDTVCLLDSAEIITADLIISGSPWESKMGGAGIKAYLRTMYVKIHEDKFAAKWNREFDN